MATAALQDKHTIIGNFSRYAHLYDRYAEIQYIAAAELIAETPCRAVNILETGCGTGNYTRFLKEKFDTARITASDISDVMIGIARCKFRSAGIEFKSADAGLIPPEGGYDLITSNAVFQWLRDPDAVLAKSRDGLTEGGELVFSSFGPETFFELRQSLEDALKEDLLFSASGFPDKDGMERMLGRYFIGASVREKIVKKRYGSLMELLNSIKYTGTRGDGIGGAFAWNKRMLQSVQDIYRAKFGGIEASYQIFFCKARR
jgi:malonyl-CoA O-methyltransferase